MTGLIKALSWEFVRRLSVTVPLIISVMILGPLAVEGLFWIADLPTAGELISDLSWHCVYLALGFFLMAVPLVEAYKEAYRRFFTFPVSSAFIASWMITSAISAVVCQELLTHWLYGFTLSDWSYRAIFGVNRSLIGPCQPIYATMVSLLIAMFWSLQHFRFRKLFVCGVLLICFIYWIALHYYPDGFQVIAKSWTTFTFVDSIVCIVIIAASWFVTWNGIARERCGDNVGHSFEDRVDAVTKQVREFLFPDGLRTHESPEAAIAWNQWRHCGRSASLAAGFGLGTMLAILVYIVCGGSRGLEGGVVLLFLIPGIVGLLTGSITGVLAPPSSRERMTMFLATSPVSDARLARGLLWNAWRTTLIAWGLVLFPALVTLGVMIVQSGISTFQVQIDRLSRTSELPFGVMILPLAVLGSGLLAWILTGTFAVLNWTGNQLLPLVAIMCVLAHTILLAVLSFFLESDTITLLREVSMGIATIAIVGGSAWGFYTALERKMVKSGSAALLLSFWGCESLLCWICMPAPPIHRLFVIGILILSVSPVVFAPLAISRNRHAA